MHGIIVAVTAARFAKEGIDDIWFALFPHPKVDQMRALETALIDPVSGPAVKWNQSHKLPHFSINNASQAGAA